MVSLIGGGGLIGLFVQLVQGSLCSIIPSFEPPIVFPSHPVCFVSGR